jgi:hypothetical protein
VSGVEDLRPGLETVRSCPSGLMNGRPKGGSAAPLGHSLSRRVTSLPHAALLGIVMHCVHSYPVRLSRRKSPHRANAGDGQSAGAVYRAKPTQYTAGEGLLTSYISALCTFKEIPILVTSSARSWRSTQATSPRAI